MSKNFYDDDDDDDDQSFGSTEEQPLEGYTYAMESEQATEEHEATFALEDEEGHEPVKQYLTIDNISIAMDDVGCAFKLLCQARDNGEIRIPKD